MARLKPVTLPNMKISLDLHRNCIQTAVKQKYNRLIADYFKTPSAENQEIMESEIAILKTALETLDFGKLRAEFPALRGCGMKKISIGAGTGNTLTITVNGKVIYETHSNQPSL